MRNDVLMNKRQRAVLYSLLLSAGFIASPALYLLRRNHFPLRNHPSKTKFQSAEQ